ncbi:hypothetical protein HanIR_Chr13g0628341 [Helianthus annuus]|nr:hypothetical protein HanIR_Chr13g0628341 [Helianthus annuus]
MGAWYTCRIRSQVVYRFFRVEYEFIPFYILYVHVRLYIKPLGLFNIVTFIFRE